MSNKTITLQSGAIEATIAPSLGGALLRYQRDGADVLRPGDFDAVQSDPRNAAYFPCVPFFGRMAPPRPSAFGDWSPRPTLPQCEPNFALHGDGWVSPWRVETASAEAASLSFVHRPTDGAFPFAYTARQHFEISTAGLQIVLEATNDDGAPMPCGLALHPFFPRLDNTQVDFHAKRYWIPPSADAPGALSSLPDEVGGGEAAALPATPRDHTYVGVGGVAQIWRPGLRTNLSFSSPHLHAFLPAPSDYFCLEPCSQLPGDCDPGRPLHGRLLPPGHSRRVSMTINADAIDCT